MFRWLTDWIRRRRLASRGLFPYHDGRRLRHADPFTVWRLLHHHPELNMEAIGPLVDEGREPETSQLIAALAEIFDVLRFDDASGRGMTDWEILGLLAELDEFLDGVKKNSST